MHLNLIHLHNRKKEKEKYKNKAKNTRKRHLINNKMKQAKKKILNSENVGKINII